MIRQNQSQPLRIGDSMQRLVRPIAQTIDRAFGTDLQNCAGCDNRREQLNRITDNARRGNVHDSGR